MSLAGSWKKVKVDNGMAFGKAIGATDEQLAAQAQAVSTVTYEINGNNIKVTRVHKIGDKEIVSCWLVNYEDLIDTFAITAFLRKLSTKLISDQRANSKPKERKSNAKLLEQLLLLKWLPPQDGQMPLPKSLETNWSNQLLTTNLTQLWPLTGIKHKLHLHNKKL